ncbi:MAG: hypothetical protein KF726_04055 [Anaerolineae bacterium]|nr:hypothetical protein [Anaerolineae bacterium]
MSTTSHEATNQLQGSAVEDRRFRFCFLLGLVGVPIGFAIALLLLRDEPMVRLLISFNEPNAENTVGVVFIATTMVTAFFVTLLAYRRFSPVTSSLQVVAEALGARRSDLIGRMVVGVIVWLLTVALTVLAFFLIDQVFAQVRITRAAAILVAGLYGGIFVFSLAWWASTLLRSQLLTLAAVTLVVFIALAGATSGNRTWWAFSLSYLGAEADGGLYFNIGIILTALILFAVAQDILFELYLLNYAGVIAHTRLRLLRLALFGVTILLALVGVFPVRSTPFVTFLHNLSAHAMALLFVVLMLCLRLIAPFYSKRVMFIGFACGGGIVLLFVLYALKAINFVFLEIALAFCIAPWFAVFERDTYQNARQANIDPAAIQVAHRKSHLS